MQMPSFTHISRPISHFFNSPSSPSTHQSGLTVSRQQSHFMGDGSWSSLAKTVFLGIATLGLAPLYYMATNDFDEQINARLKDRLQRGDPENAATKLNSSELKVIKAIILALHEKKDDIVALFGKCGKFKYDVSGFHDSRIGNRCDYDDCVEVLPALNLLTVQTDYSGEESIYITRKGVFLRGELLLSTPQLLSHLQDKIDWSGKTFLTDTHLEGMNFQNRDMSRMYLDGVHLAGAKLNGANLTGTKIHLADFGQAIHSTGTQEKITNQLDVFMKKIQGLVTTVESIDAPFQSLKFQLMENIVDQFKAEFESIDRYKQNYSRNKERYKGERQQFKNQLFPATVSILRFANQFDKLIEPIFILLGQIKFDVIAPESHIQKNLLNFAELALTVPEKKAFISLIAASNKTKLVTKDQSDLEFLLTAIEKMGEGKGQFMSDNAAIVVQLFEIARSFNDSVIQRRAIKLEKAYNNHVIFHVLIKGQKEMLDHFLSQALEQINEKSYLTKNADYLLELINAGKNEKDAEIQSQVNLLEIAFQEKLKTLLVKAIEKAGESAFLTQRSGYVNHLIQVTEKYGDPKLIELANLLNVLKLSENRFSVQ